MSSLYDMDCRTGTAEPLPSQFRYSVDTSRSMDKPTLNMVHLCTLLEVEGSGRNARDALFYL